MKQTVVDPNCAKSPTGKHWWLVEPQNGPMSGAKCKFCKAKTTFRNSRKDEDKTPIVVKPHSEWLYDVGYRKSNAKF